MSRLTWWRVTLAAGVAAVLGWLVGMVLDRSGSTPSTVPWTVAPLLLVFGAVALAFGWRVREYRAGKRPSLDPLEAARTAMFAQAAAYCGAVVFGGYLGYGLAFVQYWSHEPRREIVVSAIIAAGAAAILCGAGWVAERWCDASRGDDDRGAPPSSAAQGASG